jgi:lysozyme family protein
MTHLDELSGIDRMLCWAVTDWAVNSGHLQPIRALQAAVGVGVDGVLGTVTLNSVAHNDVMRATLRVNMARIKFLCGLVVKTPADLKFLNGWITRVTSLTLHAQGIS